MHNRREYSVIDAPSILGLRPTGVELLPKALRAAGLLERLNAQYCGIVAPSSPYNHSRDEETKLLNAEVIKEYSLKLAETVKRQLHKNKFPIVIGGDCSILIGNLLALRRLGRYGLFFIDGHSDFYLPEESPTGEVADMDLAIVSGHGPDILSNLDHLKPLVKEQDIVVFGYRDSAQSAQYGCQDIKKTTMINAVELVDVKKLGLKNTATLGIQTLLKNELSGFWIHLDADVLDDSIMPAVDYRLPDGITFPELSNLLKLLLLSKKAMGISVTIFNPTLDKDGSITRNFVSSIVEGLS
ncbi:MAG: arginase family protein [Nitrososphaeraceae archaeon]|jgi:arginase|nr:arginase family protein [Nitrososphaeraceae archaeon]MDW0177823.1 arginase family protein [Nitrososphaeraceae archaeon]MDW0184897.1 arginase family protein [Nitrososphaeraceae archaeon]MDW0188519.1 arginase family protein [Nitrososphaeraceae archaeon]MDW0192219.1 arginase family protein [Nitrososphaeraceae archaeon]